VADAAVQQTPSLFVFVCGIKPNLECGVSHFCLERVEIEVNAHSKATTPKPGFVPLSPSKVEERDWLIFQGGGSALGTSGQGVRALGIGRPSNRDPIGERSGKWENQRATKPVLYEAGAGCRSPPNGPVLYEVLYEAGAEREVGWGPATTL